MKIIYMLVFMSGGILAEISEDKNMHAKHIHKGLVDGSMVEIDSARFNQFISNVSNQQIAVVSVKGMVCDFCARGLEKTFVKDPMVKKIDVDLAKGKVLIAYDKNKIINFEEIKQKITANGQNAIDLKIIEV